MSKQTADDKAGAAAATKVTTDAASAARAPVPSASKARYWVCAVQRLALREQFAKVRAENDARAFKPLYASLSPEQQQVANQLVAPRHERHHRA